MQNRIDAVELVRSGDFVSPYYTSFFGAGAVVLRKLDLWTCSKLSSSLQLAVLPGSGGDLAENWRYVFSLQTPANVLHASVKGPMCVPS